MKKYLDGAGLKNVLQRIKGKLDLKADKDELAIQSNPNLLDNWYFVNPINQRGNSEYHAEARSYTIDRWVFQEANDNLIVRDGYIELYPTNGNKGCYLIQHIEQVLVGETLTASVLLKSGKLYHCTGTISATAGMVKQSIFENGIIAIYQYQFSNYQSTGVFLCATKEDNPLCPVAVKLELGIHQTLAHKEGDTWVLNDPAPDPALELAKCQRYQLAINNTADRKTQVHIGIAYAYSTKAAMLLISTPVTLRSLPSVVTSTTQFVIAGALNGSAYRISQITSHISPFSVGNNHVETNILTDDDVFISGNLYKIWIENIEKEKRIFVLDANL